MGGIADSLFGGGDDYKMPVVQADNPSKQAEAIAPASKGLNRQQQIASLMLSDWYKDDDKKLGATGTVGI